MLVQYTSLSSLSPEDMNELRALVSGMVLEGKTHFVFKGKMLSVHELQVQKRVWENQSRGAAGQPLFG